MEGRFLSWNVISQTARAMTGEQTLSLLMRGKERDFVNKEKGLPKKSFLAALLTLAGKSVGGAAFKKYPVLLPQPRD